MVKPKLPVKIPLYTRVLPEVAANPLAVVNVIPRFELRLTLPEACKAPPDNVIESAVNVPGAVPKLASELIDKIPPEIVVLPEYVFAPDKVNVPEPDLLTAIAPEMTCPTVILPTPVNVTGPFQAGW